MIDLDAIRERVKDGFYERPDSESLIVEVERLRAERRCGYEADRLREAMALATGLISAGLPLEAHGVLWRALERGHSGAPPAECQRAGKPARGGE